MGKKLDKLAARVLALEEAIAAMLSGGKPKKSARKKKSKKAVAKKAPAKAPTKASAPKKARRRAQKAKPKAKPAPVAPLPLAATL